MNVLRLLLIAATTVYPNSWMEGPVTTGLFNGANLQRLLSFVGAIAMMFSLYKCGLNLRIAGETILGYFIIGYSMPSSVFLHSYGYTIAANVDSHVLGYPVQVVLGAAFVIGWMYTVGAAVTAIVIGQFKFVVSAVKGLTALVSVSSRKHEGQACKLRNREGVAMN